MADILVVDDTQSIRNTLAILLDEEGYTVRLASNGDEALAEYARKRPDMLLLDVMMPKKNGHRVLKQIRQSDPALPVIFLSAKGSPEDVSLGLNLGADDYLPKPFDSNVLISRIKAVFRRTLGVPAVDHVQASSCATPPGDADGDFWIGSHRIDVKRYTIVDRKGGEEVISLREKTLLQRFAQCPGEVISRETLLKDYWGMNFGGSTRTVDQHILQLRRKLGDDADCIETVHGIGYRYAPN